MTVSFKPLCMPLEAFLSLSLKPSLWMFIRLAPGLKSYIFPLGISLKPIDIVKTQVVLKVNKLFT